MEPSELSPLDWLGESDESSEEEGGCFGANYRSDRRDIAGGVSDTDSASSVGGLGGAGGGSDDEDPYAEIRTGLAEASSEGGSEAGDGLRCASPEPLPLAAEESDSDEQEAPPDCGDGSQPKRQEEEGISARTRRARAAPPSLPLSLQRSLGISYNHVLEYSRL